MRTERTAPEEGVQGEEMNTELEATEISASSARQNFSKLKSAKQNCSIG